MATQKFKELIHYICWKCDDPAQLGATKLNKIPWFVDTLAYRVDGAGLTGETYIKRQFGPVPKNILSVLSELEKEGKIVTREPLVAYQPREHVAITPPDISLFSERELRLIDLVIEDVCKHHTSGSISELSHDQIWAAAALGEEIPLYATLAANAGEITEKDYAWADSIVAEVIERKDAVA
jgi:hypothetical protein